MRTRPQRVTGQNVNQAVTVPKEKRHALRGEILTAANMETVPEYLLRSIRSKISYVMSVSSSQGLTLQHLAEKYLPDQGAEGKRPKSDETRDCNSFARHRFRPDPSIRR